MLMPLISPNSFPYTQSLQNGDVHDLATNSSRFETSGLDHSCD